MFMLQKMLIYLILFIEIGIMLSVYSNIKQFVLSDGKVELLAIKIASKLACYTGILICSVRYFFPQM